MQLCKQTQQVLKTHGSVGTASSDANTTGAENTAMGACALGANTTASYNTASW